ncbi:MAG: CPBP family intramembrane glutamic endopeptidase [Candidatus Neomarinimicrobiota bacterium]|nr:CPBP family intramembrane glutamic endopeptidase [Candidatus Neomarinimicrobiota bacterium]
MKSRSYWTVTNTPLYSFIFTLPLLLIYEVGIFAISASDLPLLRNGADVLMRQILEMFGILGTYGFGGTFLIGFIIAFLRQKKELEATHINGEYLLTMLFESIGWAFVLMILMIRAPEYLMSYKDERLLQQVVLAIGAGIYEEFAFRVILITGFAYILGLVFQWGTFGKNIGSVLLAASLFSIFHFVGPYGEDPSTYLFLIRFMAGIFLGVVYIFRGFGIAAYTHTIYDLFVLIKFTTSS